MKIRFNIILVVVCLLILCSGAAFIVNKANEANRMAYNYIFGDSVVVNEYIEKVVKALNTNDRELLASLFPEHAKSKIDNFDEKIDRIIKENKMCPGTIIRYKLVLCQDLVQIKMRGSTG